MLHAVLKTFLLITLSTTSISQLNINLHSSDLSQSITDFGLQLQSALLQSKNHDNIVLSPTSIYGVLALTFLGSVGKTYEEFVENLNFLPDFSANLLRHRLLGQEIQDFNSADNSSQTLYATGLFVDNSIRLSSAYKDFVVKTYNAAVTNVNFKDGERTRDGINRWVADRTDNMIKDLLKYSPSPDTKVILSSAIYFKGEWLYHFLPRYTQKLNFSTDVQDITKNVAVDTMLNFGKFRYSISLLHDCELLALPYKDTKTVMYILKPLKPRRKSLGLLLKEMTASKLDKLINDSKLKEVVLRLPKMKVSARTNLSEPLIKLGLRSMFSSKDANFALMADANNRNINSPQLDVFGTEIVNNKLQEGLRALPNPGLYVEEVFHDAAISLNEYGTEAAAATAVVQMARSAVLFYVNSPFFLFIRNEESKLVLFSASIFDPSKCI